jgi:hypothetical protein
MSLDFGRQLRESMDRLTTDVHVPAGLVEHAVRRHRRIVRRHHRRIATLTVVACVTVGGAAGYLAAGPRTVAGHVGTHGGARPPQALTVAYLLHRAAQAAGQQHLIESSRTVELGASNPAAGRAMVAWSDGIQYTASTGTSRNVVSDDGRVLAEYDSTWGHGTITTTIVDYLTRTWQRTSGPYYAAASPPPNDCSVDFSSADFYAFLHWGLYCIHDLRIAGRATVDGVQTIKIVAVNHGPSPITLDYWVNPQTFLPVRRLFDNDTVLPAVDRVDEQTDYEWLAPDPAVLAKLAVRIPTGYRWDPSQTVADACLPPQPWDIQCA